MNEPNHINPPSWIERLLKFLLDEEVAESVVGDITEKFRKRAQQGNRRKATFLYVVEGLGLLRLIGQSKCQRQTNPSTFIGMIRNYSIVAFRNLKRERLYSVMNVSGMAIGIACFIVICCYIRFELSYDRYHVSHDRIYRIASEFDERGERVKSARTNPQVFNALHEGAAGIENVIRILPLSGIVSTDGVNKFRENNFCFADSTFFSTFSFQLIDGFLDHALHAPLSVVLTEYAARRYFGSTDIVGRQLTFEDEEKSYTFNVTGVIHDFLRNSHFRTEFIASFSSLKLMPFFKDEDYPPLYVYVQTNKETLPESVSDIILTTISKSGIELPEFFRASNPTYFVQPLDDIHLHSNLNSEWEVNTEYIYIQAFAALGLFILFIACINFINLATAQAEKRGREIGVRKVLGGLKDQLTIQFLTETFVYVLIAFALACGIAELSLRFFLADILGNELSLLSLVNIPSILIAIGFILVITFLAGIYPSLYLSQLMPIAALKGLPVKSGRDYLRHGLVSFQIVISCMLITATIVILKQVEYFKTSDLGFQKENIVSISLSDRHAQKNYIVLSEKLSQESAVISTGLSHTLPGRTNFYRWPVKPKGADETESRFIKTLGVDEGFVRTYNLSLIKGRDFSRDIPSDQTEAFIINEAAAEMFGWQQAVGQELELTVYIGGRQVREGTVIGLVKDFHFESLYQRVDPLILFINKHPYYAENLSVRMRPGELSTNIERIRAIWNNFHPERPMEYTFIDQDLDRLYQSETRLSKILSVISIIAVSISGLGLFSLSSYSASRRAREMSIRKIFGASSLRLLTLQYRLYVALVLIANAISIPICVQGLSQWLDSIPYRISLDAPIFVSTLIGSMVVTLLVITFHTLRVAVANPVTMIRNE